MLTRHDDCQPQTDTDVNCHHVCQQPVEPCVDWRPDRIRDKYTNDDITYNKPCQH
jgi:hypothetical protein